MPGTRGRYTNTKGEARDAVTQDKPAIVREDKDGCLKVVDTGSLLQNETSEEEDTFYQHLLKRGGGWFWDGLRTPDGVEWTRMRCLGEP